MPGFSKINPNVSKVGGLQSQGVKGEAVVAYRDPLTTQDLKSSGFPEGETTWQNRPYLSNTPMVISKITIVFAMILTIITNH
jgi:hypothetical protein